MPAMKTYMFRVVAKSCQLHAEIHYLIFHYVHSNLFFLSITTCGSNDNKSPLGSSTPGEWQTVQTPLPEGKSRHLFQKESPELSSH